MKTKVSNLNRSKIFISIIILVIIMVVALGTYALSVWTSRDNTELTIRIAQAEGCVANKGPDINISNIGPIFDYELDGEQTYFSVSNANEDEISMNVDLKITTITDNLKEETFKYVVMSSSDGTNYSKVTEGNFETASNNSTINLVSNQKVNAASNIFYKIIFYIDGNVENPISMQGGSLVASIATDACLEKQYATDMIMTLASEDACAAGGVGVCATNSYTAADGSTQYHDYRYRGGEGVNNFVSFNNDLYRIIGVFDENSHGVEGEYLIKLIMADELTSTSYGVYNSSATSGTYSSYNNDWKGNTTGVKANANVLLNEYFYGKTNTSNTYGVCSTWTYYNNNTTDFRTNDCTKIVGYGVDNTLQNYIEDVIWYLKGYTGSGYSKQNFYLCERGQSTDTTNCMSGNSGSYDASTTARIGLMYASDYLYASSYYADTDTTTGGANYYGNKNWLYNGYEWTITPDADSADYAFYVSNNGYVYADYSYYGYGVRPTFYLKSNILINGGEGTINNPFTLST